MITRRGEGDRDGGTGRRKGEKEERMLANVVKEVAVFHRVELKQGAQAGRGT